MNQALLHTQERQRTLDMQVLTEDNLDNVINTFEPVRLQEMDAVALLNRVDTKYILSTGQLLEALRAVRADYRILEIQGRRMHHYQNQYFDTPGFTLYHQHVTGRAHVYKVREREYLDTQLAYLEVKHKDPKKRTEKSRLPVSPSHQGLDRPMRAFLGGFLPCDCQELEPKLWNNFRRITLVSKTDLERLTIDVDLCFFNDQQMLYLNGIAVAEIKQDTRSRCSGFAAEMRRQGIRESGFSKYCFGAAQLYDTLKQNTQKERVLRVKKLQHGGMDHV